MSDNVKLGDRARAAQKAHEEDVANRVAIWLERNWSQIEKLILNSAKCGKNCYSFNVIDRFGRGSWGELTTHDLALVIAQKCQSEGLEAYFDAGNLTIRWS